MSGAVVFKSLKDRLKGVSSRLEDELEAQLEAELDAELEAEMAKELPTVEPEPVPEPTPEPVPEPEPTPEPTREPESISEPAPDATPEPDGEEPPATDSNPAEATPPAAVVEAPTTVEHQEPARESVTPAPNHAAEAVPAPTESAVTEPDVPSQPEQQEAPAHPHEVSDPAATAVHESPAKPAQVITGRKQFTDAEIEARLAAELEAAVDIQKDVETVVSGSGAKLTKFTINEDVLEEILWDLEIGLLESDVALPVIEAIKENVKEQLLSMSVGGKSAAEVVEKVLKSAVRRVLNVGKIDFDEFVREKLASGKKPVVVMFVGVNGTGKTTSIARIAHRLKSQGLSPVLAAGDTFRAGAIAQLSQHADVLGVKCVKHSDGADPAAVAFDAIEHAKARHKDVVLLDTAGRMQTNTNLMDEMDKIRRVANPDLVVFVGDSLAGNDAVEQARKFDEVVDINGAILTKVDVDAKGGAALSVAYTINKPLLFVGVGQGYEDLKPFDADWMVSRLFGDDESEA